ncbi:MAG: DUF4147 domain-containing protein [Patescibacteria group bacterium]
MRLIKNFDQLAFTPQRKIVLEIIEEGFASMQPAKIINKNFSIKDNKLIIQHEKIDLLDFKRIFLLGFGKGSSGISKQLESILGNYLTQGCVIDVVQNRFSKIEFTLGTHPLPSRANVLFTKNVLNKLSNLTERDLVIVVIAGGGSALFVDPYRISLEKLIEVNKSLLRSGANISEMNIVRKHLSKVKGGGLAKHLYPAMIVSLIVSDVPGNDLSVVASGPTVKDSSTKTEAFNILHTYNLWDKLNLSQNDFLETPKKDKYFENVTNILILSNKTALLAMQQKAKELGFNTIILSDKFQGEAKFVGKELIEKTPPHTILVVGGETTVKVKGLGEGGRNQEVILGTLSYLTQDTVIASFDSDGWDNSYFAGAIGDFQTIDKAQKLHLNIQEFQETNNVLPFFEKVGDGIVTGKLPSNVSDLMVVLRE